VARVAVAVELQYSHRTSMYTQRRKTKDRGRKKRGERLELAVVVIHRCRPWCIRTYTMLFIVDWNGETHSPSDWYPAHIYPVSTHALTKIQPLFG
jgi:hypothetical protein